MIARGTVDPAPNQSERGFSLVELLVVVAVLGVLAMIVVPGILSAVERARQRGTLADMHSLGTAFSTYRLDVGSYPGAVADLEPTHMSPVPESDAWGNAWGYVASSDKYQLTSFGTDGAAGPATPALWVDEPYEGDLLMSGGMFTQYPTMAR